MKSITYESSAVINGKFYEFLATAESKDDNPNTVDVHIKAWGDSELIYTNDSTYKNEKNPWAACCEYDETTLIEDYVQGKLVDAQNAIGEDRPSEDYTTSCIGGVQKDLHKDWWGNFRATMWEGLTKEEQAANCVLNLF